MSCVVACSVGSHFNVDRDDTSAMIRRFLNPAALTEAIDWNTGEIWARGEYFIFIVAIISIDGVRTDEPMAGLRNEVGIRFDFHSPRRLWGVENGVDNIIRACAPSLGNWYVGITDSLFQGPGGCTPGQSFRGSQSF